MTDGKLLLKAVFMNDLPVSGTEMFMDDPEWWKITQEKGKWLSADIYAGQKIMGKIFIDEDGQLKENAYSEEGYLVSTSELSPTTFQREGMRYYFSEEQEEPVRVAHYKNGAMYGVDGFGKLKWGMTKTQVKTITNCKHIPDDKIGVSTYKVDSRFYDLIQGTGVERLNCVNYQLGKNKIFAVFYFIDGKLQRLVLTMPKDLSDVYQKSLEEKYGYPSGTNLEVEYNANSLTNSVRVQTPVAYLNDTIKLMTFLNTIAGVSYNWVYENIDYKEMHEKSLEGSIK